MKSRRGIPFFLAYRFLKRSNKWALALIIILMSVAFINLIFIDSLLDGIVKNTDEQIINTTTGNIIITPIQGHEFIENASSLVSKVETAEGVVAASSLVVVPATIKYKNIVGNWGIFAIDPDKTKKVTDISEKMESGSYLDSEEKGQIIIGRQVAGGEGREMEATSFEGAKAGDKVTLHMGDVQRELTIKGIFNSGYLQTDDSIFITTPELEGLSPEYGDRATRILVRIDVNGRENEVIKELKALGIEENISTWHSAAGLVTSISESFKSVNAILTVVGLIIAAVTIFIIVYVDINHRRQQIGILRAIGIDSRVIRRAYVLQSAFYALCGIVVGTVLFMVVIVPYYLSHPMSIPIAEVTLAVNYTSFTIQAVAIVVVAIFSGYIPSVIVTRANMLEEVLGK